MSRTALEGITKRPSNSTGTRNKEFSMPKNPLEKRCEDLSREIRSLEQKSQELQQILQWYRSTSEPQLITALHTSQRQAEDVRTLLWQCEREIAELSKQLRDVESQLGSWLNPFNWFCPKQQLLRENCANLRSALSKKQKQYGQAKTQLNALEARIEQLKNQLQQYRTFDLAHHESQLAEVQQQIALKKEELGRLSELKRQLDQKLRPLYDEVETLEEEKRQLKSRIQMAEDFQRRLDEAPNGRARGVLHQECKEQLGDGSPLFIIRESRCRLRAIERDLEKLYQRIHQEISAFLRNSAIEEIIIDGSNLCYEDGCFIGLAALKVLVPELVNKNYRVVVVFDASIRHKLKTGDEKITRALSPAKVHIVNTRQAADTYVLDLASQDEHAYVLSNDRFAEYPDSSVVQAGRILRHEIVNGQIYIPDLQIRLTYGSA
jgi:predicted  nucleic acid-binding Zn-ribbon protein